MLKSVSMMTMSSGENHREERGERKIGFMDEVYNMLIIGSFPFYRPQKKTYDTGYQ